MVQRNFSNFFLKLQYKVLFYYTFKTNNLNIIIMVWLVVEQNGSEYIYSEKPILEDGEFLPSKVLWHNDNGDSYDFYDDFVQMPRGSIKCLLGRELTFEESPYPFFNVGKQDMERVNTFKL